MPKPTHIITGPASGIFKALSGGSTTENSAVYGQADLNRRLAAAKAAGVKVTVKPAR